MADRLYELAERVIGALIARGWTAASAESCTGGQIGHALTEIPGSSAAYLGGVIAYANEIKIGQLGVPAAIIDAVGAVSPETARAMAEGARERLGATVGLATTGIAGPGGGSADKPVGLVYLSLALPGETLVERHIWAGGRSANKLQSVERILAWLLERIEERP
ncbi:MAG TPA: CinA family protein [Herpetosiphonaceae bacterium]